MAAIASLVQYNWKHLMNPKYNLQWLYFILMSLDSFVLLGIPCNCLPEPVCIMEVIWGALDWHCPL